MNKSPLSAWLEYLPIALVLPLVRFIPYRAIPIIAEVLGVSLYYLLPRYRRIALINLNIAFADELSAHEAQSVTKQAFINFIQTILEFILLSRMSGKEVASFTKTPVGYQEYQTILQRNQGVIVCSVHFSNWYWSVICAAIEGHKVNAVVRALDNPHLDKLMNQAFARWGIAVIPRNKVYPKAITALRRGETLALMIDQNAAIQGCFVPFFGMPAATMRGLVVLKRGTQAEIVCVHDVREGLYHRAVLKPMRNLPDDEQACLLQIHRYFEQVIRQHKGLYFWLHSRWKTRPEGEASVYQQVLTKS